MKALLLALVLSAVASAQYYPPSGGGSGTGNVTGPASSTSNNLAKFNGATGKVIADAGATVTTSVGTPGADTNVPTEKAVRSAIATASGGTVTSSGTPLIHQVPVWTTATDLKGITVPASGTLLQGVASSDPSWTATPTLGVAGATAGTLAYAGATAGTFTLGATPNTTASNTLLGPAAVVTNGNLLDCSTSSTTCTLHDSGVATANVVTAASNFVSGQLIQGGGANKTSSDSGVVAANVITDSGNLTDHGVALGSGNKTIISTAVGATNTVLNGNTGADPSFGAVPLAAIATQAADTMVMNATGGTAAPTAVAMPTSGTNGCAGTSNALTYNTSTHALGCNTISGSGNTTSTSLTTNKIPKADGANSIVNSSLSDDGTTVSTTEALAVGSVAVGTTPPSVTPGTGGVWASAEGTAPSVCATTGVGCLYNDSTQHGLLMSRNNGSYLPIPQGPASTTSGNLASWNATNGGLMSDSGVAAANVTTAASNYTSGNLVQAAGNNKTTSDSAIATANVVTAASNYTNGNLVQAAGANKTTSDSGVVAANVITDSGNLTNHGVAIGSGNKTIGSTAVGATDKPLVGVTGGDPAFSKLTLTNPATASTLTIADGKTLTASNTLTLTGTDSSSVAFGGGGTVAYTIASGTSALGTSAISSGACATVVTTSATGTATTDVVQASFNGDPTGVVGYEPSANGMLTIIGYPTANNVNWKVCNNSGASITPGAITLNWRVTR